MANIRSQIKRNRQNKKRELRNRGVRSELKTRMKTAVSNAESNDAGAIETLRLAMKKLDMAASKGVIHKNQAANRKSGLAKRIAKLTSK